MKYQRMKFNLTGKNALTKCKKKNKKNRANTKESKNMLLFFLLKMKPIYWKKNTACNPVLKLHQQTLSIQPFHQNNRPLLLIVSNNIIMIIIQKPFFLLEAPFSSTVAVTDCLRLWFHSIDGVALLFRLTKPFICKLRSHWSSNQTNLPEAISQSA